MLRREDALANNLRWYGCVMDAHEILYERTEHVWLTTGEVPPYYSNLVTCSATGTHEQLACIRALVAVPPKPTWGLADSFASLDPEVLQALGFALLFEADWFGHTPSSDVPTQRETDVVFAPVQGAEALAAWEAAWRIWSPPPHPQVFPPSLLDIAGVTFWAAHRGGDVVGGAITHIDGNTIGLSNVFIEGAAGSGTLLRDAARTAQDAGAGRTVVGYGTPEDLADLAPLGFTSLGVQRVWLSGADAQG